MGNQSRKRKEKEIKFLEGMKTEYQYIHFIKKAEKPKTSIWSCRNNRSDNELGEIKWYSAWRQYCYFPTVQAIYNVGCLENINHFISQLMTERKKK